MWFHKDETECGFIKMERMLLAPTYGATECGFIKTEGTLLAPTDGPTVPCS